jgi:N-acetyl-anhydromuramyl-L-alanine amidase AmpD
VLRTAPARDWKIVVLHHSATPAGGMAAFDRMHKARGWDGVGYHFVVGNGTDTPDGALETTFRWREQREGAHAKGWNDLGIGVCLVGNFEETDPTPAQLETVKRLVRWLRARFSIPPERVVGHGRLGTTFCPGKRFSVADVVSGSAPGSSP